QPGAVLLRMSALDLDKDATLIPHGWRCGEAELDRQSYAERALEVEIDPERMTYRVCLEAMSPGMQYDAQDFAIPIKGLAPRGAKAHIRDAEGRGITQSRGYSTFDYWSGTVCHDMEFKGFPESGPACSEPYKLNDLVRSLDRYSGTATNDWNALQVTFGL